MSKPRFIFIQPPEKPSSTTTSSPALINLAVDLGEFKALSGIEFLVEQYDRMILKITYWQDEAFIALRLKFGQWFVPEPVKRTAASPSPRPAVRPPAPKPLSQPDDGWDKYDFDIWKRKVRGRLTHQDTAELARRAIEKMNQDAEIKRRKRESAAAEADAYVKADGDSGLKRVLARFRK